MARNEQRTSHGFWVESIAIIGLLVAIAVAGLVGLGINARVRSVTDQVLKFDIALEDRGDDLRVAVLDMRHYHRNLIFAGPSVRRLADLDAAYAQLLAEINQLEELGIDDLEVPSPEELREFAKHYYAEFRPAVERYHSDPDGFEEASESGLHDLVQLEAAAVEIHLFGEQRAAAALRVVEAAANGAQLVLIAVLGGLILVGAGLAYLIVHNRRDQQRASTELARALQLKSDFIADASHELRTPLTVLRANAEVALQLERGCVHTDLLEEIVREAEHMTRLIEDLLFLARSDAGAIPFDWELISVMPFLRELADRASVLAREHTAVLNTELTASGVVQIDRSRIEQVVLILVDNAAKYSHENKIVTLRSRIDGPELLIEITDNGPGIPEEDLPLIFERFYRADKARTRKQGGTGIGLGLAIAKSIVDAHGGRIEAQSTSHPGTTTRSYLPFAGAAQPGTQATDRLAVGEA